MSREGGMNDFLCGNYRAIGFDKVLALSIAAKVLNGNKY